MNRTSADWNREADRIHRIVAAGPELLEALRVDLKRVEDLEAMIPNQAGMWNIWAKDIRAAIAKATLDK